MSHGHQPKFAASERPTPPTSGSGIKPPPLSGTERTLAIYEDHIARLQEEGGSWRRVAERLGAERSVATARVDTLEIALRNACHAATGGNATKSTADLLKWVAQHWDNQAGEAGAPTQGDILERAAMLETAGQMMQAALYPDHAAKDEEAEDLFQSERISAAQVAYDQVMDGAEEGEPEPEVRAFDAMKAAIARADQIAASAVPSTLTGGR